MDSDYALYQQYQADRKQKQQYLVDNIQNAGYDAGDFAHYLGWQKGKCMETDMKVLGEEGLMMCLCMRFI